MGLTDGDLSIDLVLSWVAEAQSQCRHKESYTLRCCRANVIILTMVIHCAWYMENTHKYLLSELISIKGNAHVNPYSFEICNLSGQK